MEEKKYEDEDYDEADEDYTECILTPGDRRKIICESSNKDDSIIQCIGTVESEYVPDQKINKTEKCLGTGTVMHIDSGNKIYVMSAAHNICGSEKQCRRCHTKTLRSKCPNEYCYEVRPTQKTGNLIQPTHISFERRGNGIKYPLGQSIKTYDADSYKVPAKYNIFWTPCDGYDICIIVFKCNDNDGREIYRKNTSKISLVSDVEFGWNKSTVYIYGYPGEKSEQKNHRTYHYLYGMGTSKFNATNNFRVRKYGKSNKLCIVNKAIDTTHGQSGACIYSYRADDTNQFLVYGIHCGGSKKAKSNFGTLFDKETVQWIKNVFAEYHVQNVSDKIICLENNKPIQNVNKFENIKYAWSVKHINSWSCPELQEWICCLRLNKSIEKTVVETISTQGINGEDLNSLTKITDVMLSFDIGDLAAAQILSALELIKENKAGNENEVRFKVGQHIFCTDTRYKNPTRKYAATIYIVQKDKVYVIFNGYRAEEGDWIPKYEWNTRIIIIDNQQDNNKNNNAKSEKAKINQLQGWVKSICFQKKQEEKVISKIQMLQLTAAHIASCESGEEIASLLGIDNIIGIVLFAEINSNQNAFYVGQNIECRYGNNWYDANIKKIESNRVLVGQWKNSKYDKWVRQRKYNMIIRDPISKQHFVS